MTFKDIKVSADEQLANLIVETLIQQKLVLEQKREQLQSKIINGRMTEEEWKVEIEFALLKSMEGIKGGNKN